MALFKWFGGKTAAEHEHRADELFAGKDWGKAKLEYEKALDKLEAAADPEAAAIERLNNAIRRSCQALAQEHIQSGRELMRHGYRRDAAELFELALALCQDERTHRTATDLLERSRPAAESTSISPANLAGPETEPSSTPIPTEERFMILCSMLPEALQDIYSGYGRSFQQGYVALHEGRFGEAVEFLEAAQASAPDSGSYISLELAGAYFNLDRLDESRRLLETFLQHQPEALPGYEMLSEIYWEQMDFENAWRLLNGCPQSLQFSAAYVVLKGETLRREARFEEAARWFGEHLQTYGWNDKIATALAAVYEQSGKVDEALALYARYLNNCRGCGSKTPVAVERNYADLSLTKGDHSEQILEIYLGLAGRDPANAAEYYLKVSQIYAARGNRAESLRFREIAGQHKIDP
jgi:tetratricopeptide (TPR) repeat protein